MQARIVDLLREPRLLCKLHTGAFCGAQYRLRGPHASPDMAERMILHSHSHAPFVRFLDVAVAELARYVGLVRFEPRLSLLGKIRDGAHDRVA